MPSFLPGFEVFAIAGAIAAAGPVIIHLLNRRRFRVLDWAAMDFLLEAVQRNRKILQIRDLLLLLLRTACVLLFGFALARPFFAASETEFDPDRAVHAVLVVDNSLSMGYQRFEGELLDEAKAKAAQFIDRLPDGSRISVLPLCGNPHGYSNDAYRTKEDALDALDKVEVVDRSGTAIEVADLALEAAKQEMQLSKRVVFLGDLQQSNWQDSQLAKQMEKLPELQIVDISPERPTNTWVESLQVQDAIVDVNTQTAFTAILRHEGEQPREDVQVTLSIDGLDVSTKTVSLQPGQSRAVNFDYHFDIPIEPDRPTYIVAKVSLSSDELPLDDTRFLTVPIVAALPVVFIDQLGEEEDPEKGRYGDTFFLRRLLAPVTSRIDASQQPIEIRHAKIDQVDQELLRDARLVVIAGVDNPAPAVSVLRDYTQQGGQLLIATGGKFNPELWNETAWLSGDGILPLPLSSETVGKLPDATGSESFQLDPKSLQHAYFVLPELSQEDFEGLYREPLFFRTAIAQTDSQLLEDLAKHDREQISEKIKFLIQSDANRKKWDALKSKDKLVEKELAAWEEDTTRREEMDPSWLVWSNRGEQNPWLQRPSSEAEVEQLISDLATAAQPRLLGLYEHAGPLKNVESDIPFIVQRQIERGKVVFVSSGVRNLWNTVPITNTVLIYDRILRMMLESTLPRRNYETVSHITLPIQAADRQNRFVLTRPDESQEELYVEALDRQRYGVTIRDVSYRGTYKVAALRRESGDAKEAEAKLWEIPLGVNGKATESELATVTPIELDKRLGETKYRLVGRTEEISLEGAQVYGQDLWWWLILLVLLCLLVEMSVLAWPTLRKEADG